MATCAECKTRSEKREYATLSRRGGGTYRRGGRSYRTTLCDRCIDEAMAYFEKCDREDLYCPSWWVRISRDSIERAAEEISARRET